MDRKLLFVTLFVIGSGSSVLANRMLLSQEGYQDMDSSPGGGGGGADFGPATTGLLRQSGFDQAESGPAGFHHQQPQHEDPNFSFGGPSGGAEQHFGSGNGPQMFNGFSEDGPSSGGGELSGDDGQGWLGPGNIRPGSGQPHFGGQAFQDSDSDGFEREQDSKLQAELLKDDSDSMGGGGSGFGGGEHSGGFGSEFEGPQGGGGPKSNLGGAWVGGNMISPRGHPSAGHGGAFAGGNGHEGLSEADGQSQGVTRLDSATIGARSRQLGIRPPPPQQQQQGGPRGGPRGNSFNFNKFRPMMMGFRPPRRPAMMPMPSMSEPMHVFKPQFPLASRPKLHYIPMNGGERDFELARPNGGFPPMGGPANAFPPHQPHFRNPHHHPSESSNIGLSMAADQFNHQMMMNHNPNFQSPQPHHNMYDSFGPGHAWKK